MPLKGEIRHCSLYQTELSCSTMAGAAERPSVPHLTIKNSMEQIYMVPGDISLKEISLVKLYVVLFSKYNTSLGTFGSHLVHPALLSEKHLIFFCILGTCYHTNHKSYVILCVNHVYAV